MTTITIPNNALVMLVGAAGSGKSTFAAKHFRSSEIVSSDFCREALCDDATNQKVSGEAFEMFHAWIDTRLKLGRLTVADSTALKPSARSNLRQIASRNNVPVVAIQVVVDEATALTQNASRKRFVPEHIVKGHVERATEAGYVLPSEGYHAVYKVFPNERYEIRLEGDENKNVLTGPGFDIIGDVHGCFDELTALLRKLGWSYLFNIWAKAWTFTPPTPGRKLIFVGDLTDRGPDSLLVLDMVKSLVEQGHAQTVLGNHCSKLLRKLKGNNVQIGHGLTETLEQLQKHCTLEDLNNYRDFLAARPYQVRLLVEGAPEVVVCHAGMPRTMVGRNDKAAQAQCLFGETDGTRDAKGFPTRTYSWHASWPAGDKEPIIVHGHDVVPEPQSNTAVNVVNVDQGCCFGGKLTAFRVPEMDIVQVPSLQPLIER